MVFNIAFNSISVISAVFPGFHQYLGWGSEVSFLKDTAKKTPEDPVLLEYNSFHEMKMK